MIGQRSGTVGILPVRVLNSRRDGLFESRNNISRLLQSARG
jgi:hypothetical protein